MARPTSEPSWLDISNGAGSLSKCSMSENTDARQQQPTGMYIKYKIFSSDLTKIFFRNHEFFNYDNAEALELRTQVADAALKDTLNFLKNDEGDVGIFDATNATRERRKTIFDLVRENGFKCLFLESVCDSPQLIEVKTKFVLKLFYDRNFSRTFLM